MDVIEKCSKKVELNYGLVVLRLHHSLLLWLGHCSPLGFTYSKGFGHIFCISTHQHAIQMALSHFIWDPWQLSCLSPLRAGASHHTLPHDFVFKSKE